MELDPTERWRGYLEAIQYAVVTILLSIFLLSPVSVLLGMGLVGVKIGLFLLGTGMFGYATLLAWPREPEDLSTTAADFEPSGWFHRFVIRLPPVAYYSPTPDERVSDAIRLYLAAISMYGVSYAMETLMGVTS